MSFSEYYDDFLTAKLKSRYKIDERPGKLKIRITVELVPYL